MLHRMTVPGVGHYLLVADSYEQLRSREKQMKDSIVIEYGR